MPITLILQIIGVALSAFGMQQQGVAARAQSRYQSNVAKANAKSAEMEASFAKDVAHKKEGEQRQKTRRFEAAQRARMASTGFVVGEGSFGDILEDTALIGEVDALTIRHEGDLAAWRSREQAKSFSAQSALYGMGAKDFSSDIGAGATLLTGLSEVDFSKLKRKKSGVDFSKLIRT